MLKFTGGGSKIILYQASLDFILEKSSILKKIFCARIISTGHHLVFQWTKHGTPIIYILTVPPLWPTIERKNSPANYRIIIKI